MRSQAPSEIAPPLQDAPRYSARAFPAYRYVPGLHPHPVAHPAGHSYNPSGEHPAAIHPRDSGPASGRPGGRPLLPPERWAESEDYLYGADLYNHGYWWEAHEAWEGLWQQTDKAGRQGRFLQGLIQVSAAHLKRHVGQAEGVERLLDRAFGHLDAARAGDMPGARYMGLDLAVFIEAVRAYFEGRTTVFPAIVLAGD